MQLFSHILLLESLPSLPFLAWLSSAQKNSCCDERVFYLSSVVWRRRLGVSRPPLTLWEKRRRTSAAQNYPTTSLTREREGTETRKDKKRRNRRRVANSVSSLITLPYPQFVASTRGAFSEPCNPSCE